MGSVLVTRPVDVGEPAIQMTGGAGEGVRNQVVEAVEAVDQELPLCVTFCKYKPLIGKNHIQNLLQLVLRRKNMPLNEIKVQKECSYYYYYY